LNCEDIPDFDRISTEDFDQRYVKVEFAAPMLVDMPKVEAHASNKSTMGDYYRFAQTVLSFPPMEGFKENFNLGVKQGDSSQSDGLHQ